MSCSSCRERAEMLMRAREAYQRGDMPEVRRLVSEVFGTALKDVDKLVTMVIEAPLKLRRPS